MTAASPKRSLDVITIESDAPPVKKARPPPTFQELRRTVVTVKVDQDAYPFVLYKELLCHHSKFFRNVFDRSVGDSGSSIETEEQSITLPEENVEIFEIFQLWLETQKIAMPFGDEPGQLSTKSILDLYTFADRRDIQKLRDLAISKLAKYSAKYGSSPTPAEISSVWNELHPSSCLSKYLVNGYAMYRKLDVLEIKAMDCLPQDFLFRVLMVTLDTLRLHPNASTVIQESAFTSATEEPIASQHISKELLINMVVLNIRMLRTFYTICGDTLYNSVKYGLRVCDYHEHETTEAKESCSWRTTRLATGSEVYLQSFSQGVS